MTNQLNEPYPLEQQQIDSFREDGFIRLPKVLSAETLAVYTPVINRLVDEKNPLQDQPMSQRNLYDQAFIQVSNLWESNEQAKELVFSKRLAQIATQLLGTQGIRLWHDQALYKEPSGGFTPWHVDQQYWPMESPLSVTAWIPLQPVPLEMGPLCFGRGSQQKKVGRDLEISAESERIIEAAVKEQKIAEVQEPYELGDVSFHFGWTLHRAGPNTTNNPRRVMTVIYMDRDMRLAKPKNKNQQSDWDRWTPTSSIGNIIDDPLNPVLFE